LAVTGNIFLHGVGLGWIEHWQPKGMAQRETIKSRSRFFAGHNWGASKLKEHSLSRNLSQCNRFDILMMPAH
jgi:hypothetical protein